MKFQTKSLIGAGSFAIIILQYRLNHEQRAEKELDVKLYLSRNCELFKCVLLCETYIKLKRRVWMIFWHKTSQRYKILINKNRKKSKTGWVLVKKIKSEWILNKKVKSERIPVEKSRIRAILNKKKQYPGEFPSKISGINYNSNWYMWLIKVQHLRGILKYKTQIEV
jgi:hypothetical protein